MSRSDTERRRIQTFDVTASSDSATKTTVEARQFAFEVDEPEALGGTDEAPNPVEYLLGAWAGCLNVVGHVVADELDIELDGLTIDVAGDLDPAKFLGTADDVRAGYQDVRVELTAETDADEETLDEWLEAVERRCPVGDNLANATPVDLAVTTA